MNVTPLIDVLLVLLIRFMVISLGHTVGLEAQLPQQANPVRQPNQRPRDIDLSIAADGEITINTQPIPLAELGARLRTHFTKHATATLFVQGAGALAFENVAQAIDIARSSGGAQIGLLR